MEKAEDLEYINISVEWKRNRTWGANPNAEIRTNNDVCYGSASGCGYDKESSAVAQALNQSTEVLKVLYTIAEKMIEENGEEVYYYTGCGDCISWRNSIGYGSGYGILPYFEGGVGISCFEHILNKCGFIWKHVGCGKMFDCYIVIKKEVNNE